MPRLEPLAARRSPVLNDAMLGPAGLAGAAHVVQLALTPIFLLTGLASLLNLFTTRLGRVADRVDKLADQPASHPRQLARLRLRSIALDGAVLLAALAGALTCCAALTLFDFETVLSGRSTREQAQSGGDRQEDGGR